MRGLFSLFSLLSAIIQGTMTTSKANITQLIKFARRNCAYSSVEVLNLLQMLFSAEVGECTRGDG